MGKHELVLEPGQMQWRCKVCDRETFTVPGLWQRLFVREGDKPGTIMVVHIDGSPLCDVAP